MSKASAPTRRTVAYIRVSTEEQATEGYSLEAQERSTRAYAVAREWPEVAEVYADAGVSGATRDRPALAKLLADARAGTVGRLLITKLDRVGRRAADILAIEEELDGCGVERVYIKDSIDTSTPVGRMLRTVLAAVAELERDMILERTRGGLAERARKGEVGRGRYGYIYLPGDKKAGTPGCLEVDPATAPVVRRIFEQLAAGTSASKVAEMLTREGIPTPSGKALWTHTYVLSLANNPAYYGQATWGLRKRQRVASANGTAGPRTRVQRTDKLDEVVSIAVPPIVSEELYQAARARVSQNQRFNPRRTKHEYLLSGKMLTCAHCGYSMSGQNYNGVPYYRCSSYRPDGKKICGEMSRGQMR